MVSLKESLKDSVDSWYKSIKMRFEKSRASTNINSVLMYQKIYTELMNHDIPLLKNKKHKRKIQMLGLWRNGIMMFGVVFFFAYSRIGILNRLILSLVATNLTIFVTKGYYYSKVIEDSADELSLIGQECRIQLRYHFPNHPQYEVYEEKNKRYMELSEIHKEEIENFKQKMLEKINAEKNKDDEFISKLKKSS